MLAEHLVLDAAATVRGKTVLELGAGLGLCGLVCARLGSSRVVLTDFHPRVVANLEYEVRLNELEPVAAARALDWDRLDAPGSSDGESDECAVEEKFDVVVASDVVCQDSDCDGVARALKAHLAPHGECLVTLGAPESRYGVASFEATLTRAGFRVSNVSTHVDPRLVAGCADASMAEFVGTAAGYTTWRVVWSV